jgi:Subtilase family
MHQGFSITRVAGRLAAGALLLAGGSLPAAGLDTNGFLALWATTTNLAGAGIPVAQVEAQNPAPDWEVNPAGAGVGQPPGLFTYYSTNGPAAAFPNALGAESGHADLVASLFYGLPAGAATNVAAVNNYEADYFFSAIIGATLPANINSAVANQSFAFEGLTTSQQQTVDSDYDNYAVKFGTLFVSGVNNGGQVTAPSTCYNGLGVAAYGGASSIGPTPDNGRCKPDLTAPAGYTSFSAPQVSAAAAVLLQAALRGDGGSLTNDTADLRTLKALLLNGAVKPADWTNSPASPLDARYGAGLVNIYNAYHQLTAGRQAYTVATTVGTGGAHPPTGAAGTVAATSGWDFNSLSSNPFFDAVNHYYFNATHPRFAATLVWNRQQNQTDINHLALYLYNAANSNLVLASTSAVDNVAHLYLTNLPAGRYDLQVFKPGGFSTVSPAETYALAFDFSNPGLTLTRRGANVVLTWPLLPSGLWPAATPGVSPASWSPVSPAPTITNGQYYVIITNTGQSQFFQLRQP